MPPSPRLPVHAPPPSYSRSPSYRVFNSISIVLNIMRLFVFFEFHDRMGLVTKTIARVWTDMCKATVMISTTLHPRTQLRKRYTLPRALCFVPRVAPFTHHNHGLPQTTSSSSSSSLSSCSRSLAGTSSGRTVPTSVISSGPCRQEHRGIYLARYFSPCQSMKNR